MAFIWVNTKLKKLNGSKMFHEIKPILLTAFITTTTILFVNSLLGSIILILTILYWFKKKKLIDLEIRKVEKELGE